MTQIHFNWAHCFEIVILPKLIEIKMDECFAESLIYSGSENSDGEEAAELTHVPDLTLSPEKTTQDQPNHTNNVDMSEESDDDDDMNKSIKKTKKSARILSSDEEKENSDNELHAEDIETTETQEPNKNSFNVRPSICDSDTKSSSDGRQSDTEIQTKKINKKFTKKKQKIEKEKQTSDGSESDSDSDAEGSKDGKINCKKKQSTSNRSKGSDDSSGSDSSSADSNQMDTTENVKPREKTEQRVNSKTHTQYVIYFKIDFDRIILPIFYQIFSISSPLGTWIILQKDVSENG